MKKLHINDKIEKDIEKEINNAIISMYHDKPFMNYIINKNEECELLLHKEEYHDPIDLVVGRKIDGFDNDARNISKYPFNRFNY